MRVIDLQKILIDFNPTAEIVLRVVDGDSILEEAPHVSYEARTGDSKLEATKVHLQAISTFKP